MTDKPKILTREGWVELRDLFDGSGEGFPTEVDETMDALFEYRRKTVGMYNEMTDNTVDEWADDIAKELGLE